MTTGIIIFRGMKVGVLPGDLQIRVDESGAIDSKLILSTAYNVLPIWLRIANDELEEAKKANDTLKSTWGTDDDKNRELLIGELEPSLQVFVACGIALDALYDLLRPYAKLGAIIDAWRNKRTRRARQIFEVIRRIYRLDNDASAKFTKHIEEIVKFRDLAVHPSLELRRSCTRADIPVGVDWKFSAYRYTNSRVAFEATMRMLIYIYEKKSKIAELDKQLDNVFDALEELKIIQRMQPAGASSDEAGEERT